MKPKVRVGGRYRLDEGHVVVEPGVVGAKDLGGRPFAQLLHQLGDVATGRGSRILPLEPCDCPERLILERGHQLLVAQLKEALGRQSSPQRPGGRDVAGPLGARGPGRRLVAPAIAEAGHDVVSISQEVDIDGGGEELLDEGQMERVGRVLLGPA